MNYQFISKTLKRIGFSTALKGYQYIFSAIVLTIESPSSVFPLCRKLYPYLAKKYNTTTYCIEKSIRNSIEAAWLIGDTDFLNELFQYSISFEKNRPSNLQLITTIAEYIRIEMIFNNESSND